MLEAYPPIPERQMTSLSKLIPKVVDDVADRELFSEWLGSYKPKLDLQQKGFGGSWHCEAILLSLFLLSVSVLMDPIILCSLRSKEESSQLTK